MDNEKIESLVEQLKAVGLDEEKIMDVFYETFKDGKMDRKDLETLAEFMGYELTDDFKNDAQPDPIDSNGADGEVSEDVAEEAKEIKPGESEEEFKEKIGLDGSDSSDNSDDLDDLDGSDDVEEEDEETKALKMFKA